MVIFANETGDRAAAEFVVNGTYLATDEGLPRQTARPHPARRRVLHHPRRQDRSGDDLLQPRRLAAAGPGRDLATRILTGDAVAGRWTIWRGCASRCSATGPIFDGDPDYERDYLTAYLSPGAVVVAPPMTARARGRRRHRRTDGGSRRRFRRRLRQPPEALDDIYCCARSVLLPGISRAWAGPRLFDGRRRRPRPGRRYSAFCSVIRPADHPLRPADIDPSAGSGAQAQLRAVDRRDGGVRLEGHRRDRADPQAPAILDEIA